MAEGWDAQKILDLYVLDYMKKKDMHSAAETFAKEADVPLDPVVIDAPPQGFLTEWWSIFWDVFASRLQNCPAAVKESSTKMIQNELQKIEDLCQLRSGQFHIGDFIKMLPFPVIYLLASKTFEEEHLRFPARDMSSNSRLADIDKITLTKPSSSNASLPQQRRSKKGRKRANKADRNGVSSGRSIPLDSNPQGVTKTTHATEGPPDAGSSTNSSS